jgi:hypothetical protein
VGQAVIHKEYSLHWHRNQIAQAPVGFVLPVMTLNALITCWYIGNREKKIVPFRFIKTTDLAGENKKNKKYYQT